MKFDFNDLQKCLSNWPAFPVPRETAECSLLERIRQILFMSIKQSSPHMVDFQPLIRHLLLRESINSGQEKNLRVPANHDWPTVLEWNANGVAAMKVGADFLLLTARPWHPTWLGGGDEGVFADAFSDEIVRENGPCAADPFITNATGYEDYSSPGQREAIRAAFLIPPGTSLLINLPTGSGKSLVGQAPALVHRQDGNLTVFVVPTVALAIDQAIQMEKYFQRCAPHRHAWPLAWYGGLSTTDRSEIRRRILDGTQRILFTSPEALATSLLRSIFEVTRNGMLRYLVVDEAHLITQWGDEFRPAFQALAGVRNSLLSVSKKYNLEPFRTLLLSATFTPETIDTLANLFGPPERVQMVSAVHLRPEPQYFFSKASSSIEKQDYVLEALRHAPRPFILYVTTRKYARKWYKILKSEGHNRVELFDGGILDNKRKEIIDAWRTNKIDGVIATSAFGVGIDKGDVRTIIHATIPETLDRFYQEVGRGGRDGKHSISLMVYDDSDWALPGRMATPRIISDELGYARWLALFGTRQDSKGDLFRVNLDALRPETPGSKNLDSSSVENVNWNMRTLLLMSRAGFLELHVEPSSNPEIEIDDFLPSSPLAAMAVVRIKLLRHDHLLHETWEELVSVSRRGTLEAGKRNLHLMEGLLREGREVSETLASLYANNSQCWPVEVAKVCGGCPVDRFDKKRNKRYHIPIATPIQDLHPIDFSRWVSTFPHLDPRYVIVFYEMGTPHPIIIKFIKWLVSECGIQEISIDEFAELASTLEWKNLYKQALNGILIHRFNQQLDEEPYSPLARLTIFDNLVTSQEVNKTLLLQRPIHLVFYPSRTRDPDYPHRLLSDTAINSIHLDQLNAVINQ
ncbi:ATP-dependent DNA helicase RecQ [Candidatus Parcubacteria bacterium]|nr:MAG: ATP-dependent DNA helicase RecQ [Candidatus Parcubacteria bacterium]